MPSIAGHELPTPGNADSAKQKKRREQAIVIGTLLLVVLTFLLVMRHGSSVTPSSDAGFTPGEQGGSGTQDPYGGQLPLEISAIPGQIAALDQGFISQLLANTSGGSTASVGLSPHQLHLLHLQHLGQHPAVPEHPIGVSVHTPIGTPHQRHLSHLHHLHTLHVAHEKRGRHPAQHG